MLSNLSRPQTCCKARQGKARQGKARHELSLLSLNVRHAPPLDYALSPEGQRELGIPFLIQTHDGSYLNTWGRVTARSGPVLHESVAGCARFLAVA